MVEAAVIISILGWGIAGVFAGRASKTAPPISIAAWTPFISLPILIIPLIVGINFGPPKELLFYAFLSAISLFFAWLMYFFALKNEDASPVVAIGSAYPIFSFMIFVLIGSTDIRLSVFLGILLLTAGLALTQIKGSSQAGNIKKKSLLLALGSAFAWGFWGFIDYQALQYGTAFDLMFWTFIFSACLSSLIILVLIIKRKPVLISKSTLFNRFGASFSSSLALLSFYFALSKTQSPEEIIAVTAAYPIITMVLAIYLKEERFYLRRALAIGLVVLGIIILKV